MPPRRLRSRLGPRLRAVAVLVALAAATTGCATVSALNGSARALDTYALNPLPATAATTGRSGSRVVFVADPTAPAAVASDRIVIKPNALQVTLVGDGRWVEAAPAHVRTLIARSLANTGRYALVTTGTVGPLPDFTVMTDIDGFEARLLPEGSPAPAQVVVAMTLSVVRDADGRLVASRRFTRTAAASDTDAFAVVAAFEAANGAVLREAVSWATAVMTGAPGA